MIALYFTLCLPLPYTSHTVPYWNETKRTGKGHTLTWLPSQGIFPLDAFVRVSSIVYCLCVCCVLCAVLYIDVSSALLSVLCAVHCPILYTALGCTVLYCTVPYSSLLFVRHHTLLHHTMLAVPYLHYHTYTIFLTLPHIRA